jgi:hypothetical protein
VLLSEQQIAPTVLHDALIQLSRSARDVCNYCDHVEHNEVADVQDVRRAGADLRTLAVRLAAETGNDLVSLYGRRLRHIEAKNVLSSSTSFDGCAAALTAKTWRELQLVQAEHDRVFHPDVVGTPKLDQLLHYALHLAKLAGAVADVDAGEVGVTDFVDRRLPDMVLFGIKLSTVTGETLSSDPVGS